MHIVLIYFFSIVFASCNSGNPSIPQSSEASDSFSVLTETNEESLNEVDTSLNSAPEDQSNDDTANDWIPAKKSNENTSANVESDGKEIDNINKAIKETENPEISEIDLATENEEKLELIEETNETEEADDNLEIDIKEVKFDHSIFDGLLKKHVSSSGKVAYQAFKSDETQLDSYLNILMNNPVQNSWSKNKKMAYWINAYNAFTIKLILKNYPVKSIMDLHGSKPWDVKWIKLGNETYSLNNIENDILRPQYKDARIHFAVNCAAKSCPPLLNKAYSESNLETLLDSQTKKFINDPKYNTLQKNSVKISKIFEWYSVDFDNLITYLNKYSNISIDPNAKISYTEYDWALND